MIKVVFFAALREQLDCAQLDFPWPTADSESLSVSQLKQAIVTLHPDWKKALNGTILTAVNQNMADNNATVKRGDEVAFFPPVTGG